MQPTTQQLKAARGLLDWSQSDLAAAAKVSKPALSRLEQGKTKPQQATIKRLQEALEQAGVEFIERSGVRLTANRFSTRVLEGRFAVNELSEDIIHSLGKTGGIMRIFGLNERQFIAQKQIGINDIIRRYKALNISQRLLVCEGDTFFVAPREWYRWHPASLSGQVPYYVYADRYAILLWGPPIRVVLVQNQRVSEAFRKQFDEIWDRAEIPPKV